MSQSVAMYCAAAIGAGLAAVFIEPFAIGPVFIGAAAFAWLGVGIFALVRAEVSLSGRRASSAKSYLGFKARLIGAALVAMSVIWVISMAYVRGK